MNYRIVPFDRSLREPAWALFVASYLQAVEGAPALPLRAAQDQNWIYSLLSEAAPGLGVAAFLGDQLVGFMLAGQPFTFKTQSTSAIHPFMHSAVSTDKSRIYQLLYCALAEQLIAGGINLHIIAHFTNDAAVLQTIYRLGFGAVVEERIRDLEPVASTNHVEVLSEYDPIKIDELIREHARYYRESPIFILHEFDHTTVPVESMGGRHSGNALFVFRDRGQAAAYIIVGRRADSHEGLLLQDTNTAHVLTAYVKPEARRRGVGTVLLNTAITWAKQNGFDRLFVEHETANISGGRFWSKHFTSYLLISMRYIDPSVIRV